MIVKTVEYRSMDMVRKFSDLKYDGRYIFRGQSNGFSNKNEDWNLTSSFKRYYKNPNMLFETFMIFNLDSHLFKLYFQDYSYPNCKSLVQAPMLEKLYYLQHYGIPTCFLDFTKNPIIALYFAISCLKIPFARQFQNGIECSMNEDRYVTVYQIDTQKLKDIFKVHDITEWDIYKDYSNFSLPYNTKNGIKMAIDLNPLENIHLNNSNLHEQEGCFILFDNTEYCDDMPFENVLEEITEDHLCDKIINPIIIKHNFYISHLRKKDDTESIFSYVRNEQKVTGKRLFNDIQGLKFDLLQIHDNW